MEPKAQLETLYRLALLGLKPCEYPVYKPRKGAGTAMRVNLRLEPAFEEGFVGEVKGGLFVTIAPEGPEEDGNPTFFKHRLAEHITAKLGFADITGLLASIREYRAGRPVPVYLRRGKRQEDKAKSPDNEYSNFHQTGDGSNTAITYTFRDEDAFLKLSKGGDTEQKGQYLSVTLTLGEEIAFQRYLELALEQFLRVGMR